MANGWRQIGRIPTAKQLKVRWNQFRSDARLAKVKRAHRAGRGRAEPARAGFVVGCQRSGTDMVLWALDKSLDVDRFDENHRAAFVDCRIKDGEVRRRLVEASQAKRVLFKPVCDSHRVGEMLAEHVGARAVWVYRDFRDVANSAVRRWGQMNLDWVQALAQGRGDWGRRQWNRELITPQRQQQIDSFCQDGLTPHGAAAIYWYLSNGSFFDQGLEQADGVTMAKYEALVTQPDIEFQRLCEFFEVGYGDQMVEGIFSSSVRKTKDLPIGPGIDQACRQLLERLDGAGVGPVGRATVTR